MPRLKLVTDIDDGIVMKFKRGPDGDDNEDALMTLDKDGDVGFNPYMKVFFAPGGNRTEAEEVPLKDILPILGAGSNKGMKAMKLNSPLISF